MITNLDSRETLNRGSEVNTVADIRLTCHGLISCLVAGCCCLILRKRKGQMSVAHRRELLVLIDNTDNSIRIDRTEHPVYYNTSDCELSRVGLIACFTIDEIGQKHSVTLGKLYLGYISPLRLGSKF